jgi:NAD kinase
MERLTERKIVLIVRRTRLDELISRFNTEGQAKFYVEHLGADFADYKAEDTQYKESARHVQRSLARLGRVQIVDRSFVPNFIFADDDVVAVLGQDGLVANTLKYLSGQPVIGINPDPQRWDGKLLPFEVQDAEQAAHGVLTSRFSVRLVTMAQVELSTKERLYGVNDLFIGQRSHISARYRIKVSGKEEEQSSSGIIVSTGLGSTGWLKSVIVGATHVAGHMTSPEAHNASKGFSWDADYLYYSVREPFPSRTTGSGIVFGRVTEKVPMELVSCMPENGVIFSDGIEGDFLQFNAGMKAVVSVADKKGHIVVR